MLAFRPDTCDNKAVWWPPLRAVSSWNKVIRVKGLSVPMNVVDVALIAYTLIRDAIALHMLEIKLWDDVA
jgi:hypothetical protein